MRKRMERQRGLAFPLTLFASVVVLSMSSELITIQAQADTETNQTSESIITTPESLPPSEVTEAEVTEVTEETIVETVETPEVAPVETDLVIETLSVEEEDYSTGTVIKHTVFQHLIGTKHSARGISKVELTLINKVNNIPSDNRLVRVKGSRISELLARTGNRNSNRVNYLCGLRVNPTVNNASFFQITEIRISASL